MRVLFSIIYIFFTILGVTVQQGVIFFADDGSISRESLEKSVQSYNNGVEQQSLGNKESAIQQYNEALLIYESFPEAHQNLANLYDSIAEDWKALHHHKLSVAHSRSAAFKASAIINVVLAEVKLIGVRKKERLTELLGLLAEAAEITKEAPNANIYSTAGIVYDLMGEHENALTMFQEALTHDSHHTLARLNIGNYYFKLNRFPVAMQYYLQALQGIDSADSPPDVDRSNLIFVLNNLAQCFRETGQLNLALTTFNRANEMSSSGGEMLGWMVCNVFTVKGLLCNWQGSEVAENRLEKALRSMLLPHSIDSKVEYTTTTSSSSSLPRKSSSEYYIDPYTVSLLTFSPPQIDMLTSATACPFVPVFSWSSESHSPTAAATTAADTVPRSLRVGYVSYDWRDHPMGRLTSFLVTQHNASKVNATCVSYGPDDSSDIRKIVQNASQHFVDLFRMGNDFEIATLLHSMQFDILVDITSHTYNGRIEITALKPAPIVINYLGYPGTTGCSGFDYSMVDKAVAPPEFHSRSFTESLIYLPHIYQSNNMPIDVPVCVSRLTCRKDERVTLPTTDTSNAKLYESSIRWICSFNSNKKMERISFFTWMNVMRRLPHALLLLQDTNKDAKENILREAEFFGIHRGRIFFLPTLRWKEHLFRAATCDLVLDTFVYGAHTTSSDMLWMWVPVLSLASWGSGRMPSRVAAAITQSLSASVDDGDGDGDGDLLSSDVLEPVDVTVEYSVKGYEDTAIRLLRDAQLLSKVHSLVGSRTLHSATFDSIRMERSVEQAYQLVSEYRHYAQSKAPTLGVSKLPYSIVMTTAAVDDDSRTGSSPRQLQCRSDSDSDSISSRCVCSRPRTRKSTPPPAAAAASLAPCDAKNVLVDSLTLLAKSQMLEKNSQEKYYNYNCTTMQTRKRTPIEILRQESEPLKIAVFAEAVVTWQGTLVAERSYETELEVFNMFAPFLLETYWYSPEEIVGSEKIDYSAIWRQAIDESFPFYSSLVGGLFADKPFFRALPVSDGTTSSSSSGGSIEAIRLFLLEQSYLMLHHHGVCLHALGKFPESVSVFTSAYLVHPGFINVKGYLNAGVALMDMGELDLGFMMASQSVVYEQQALYAAVNETDTESETVVVPEHLQGRRTAGLRIAFYCFEYGNAWWPEWGPSSLGKRGMGGSEEAVYYSSIELAKLGHEVFIFGDLGAVDVGYTTSYPPYCAGKSVCMQGYVKWLHYSSFDMDEPYDVFIAWRYVLSLSLSKSAKKSFVWLHDLISSSTLPLSFSGLFDGIMVQSQFHQAYVEELFTEMTPSLNSLVLEPANTSQRQQVFIVPNGIADMYVLDGPNYAHVFIYGSAPSRGLQYVLECWSYIKGSIPEAVLRVYYGFTEAFQRSMRDSFGEEQYRIWHTYMLGLLEQDGVEYYGTVSHENLTDAYRHAGFFLYPTTFQETGCISVLRAMACGCIPITSKLRESVLFNLTSPFDMGPELSLTINFARNGTAVRRWAKELWAPSVVAAYRAGEVTLRERREWMKKSVRNEYSWANTAKAMLRVFDKF